MTLAKERGAPASVSELDLGGTGAQVVFLHANGYPPECYRRLLEALSQDFRVRGLRLRPLWKDSRPASIDSWHALSSDFLTWLRPGVLESIVAVGHSLGAIVALRAAMQEPGRFRGLVLVDPVLFTPGRILVWRMMRLAPTGHALHSVIRRAERRRRVFSDVDEVFAAYRRQPIFRRLTDDHLGQVIQGLVEPFDGRLRLRYSPAWEARIYATAVWNDGDLWKGLPNLTVPTLIIRGAESDTLTETACAAATRASTAIHVATVAEATHLVPLERPLAVHSLAHGFVQGLSESAHLGA